MTSLLQRMDAQCISLSQRFLAGLGFGSWTASRDKARPGQSFKHYATALLFGLGAASGHAVTVSASSQPGSCIWHADANGLHQVQSDTNAVAQSISLKNIAAIAMNGTDCTVWAVTGKQLYKYDRNAAQALQVSLSSLDAKLNGAQLLAVDPYDDSVWLAHGKALFHIGTNGQLAGSSTVPGTIETIAVALDRSVWVLGNKQLWHYSAQGALLSSQDLHGSVNAKPKLLAIDTLGGILWLAGEKQLTRLDLNQAGQPALRIDLPHQVSAVALNPLRGELWLATVNDLLLAYGRDGGALYTVDLQANNLRDVDNLAFDPVAQSLWTASRQALGRFSATGEFVTSLSGRDGSVALAAPAFMPAPAVALVRPPQNALTNNAQPTIAYRYDALCNGQPCTFTQDYFSGYSLNATLNQNLIGPFAFDAATGQASYAPPSRLPEGQNHLSAQARDGFGNLSNIANDQFTIDTIPPSFLSVTPATGSILTAPQATIQGTIDDINATVVLEGVGAATNTGISGSSLNFSFPVILASGLNTFHLSAIDRAGNTATAVLLLTYNAAGAKVTSPVNGETINSDSVLVTGIFDGPLNIGITVNGIVAAKDGNRFFVQVPLASGANTLTVTTTTLAGASSTQTLNVFSAGPAPLRVRATPTIGLGPLKVDFYVENSTDKIINNIAVDFHGDGVIDYRTYFPGNQSQYPITSYTYTAPGTYQTRIKITDTQNRVTEQTVTVRVQDLAQLDQFIKAQWNDITSALARGDKDAFMLLLHKQAQDKYGPVFDVLKPHWQAIVATYSPPGLATLSDTIGEYAIGITENGVTQVFLIYFMQGEDGIWRLHSM